MGVPWDIRREGRAWSRGELSERRELLPEKLEVWEGRLLWSEEERLALLAMLLENVGIDRAVQLGDPERWRAAISDLHG